MLEKLFFRHKHPIIVNSIPKSGTNLLLNIVKQIPGTTLKGDFSLAVRQKESDRMSHILSRVKTLNPGDLYSGHISYTKEYSNWLRTNNIKQIFIYRDPRDVTVSLHHYIMKKNSNHLDYTNFNNLTNDQERLLVTITGLNEGVEKFVYDNGSIPNIGISFEAYSQWLKDEHTICISYEDLVDEDTGISFMKKLFRFLEIHNIYSTRMAQRIWSKGKNPSLAHTFRKGRSGGWQEEYKEEHRDAFSKVFSDELLNKFGYKL